MADIKRLLDIMERLRDPEHGCPWDRAQTFKSIVPHTLEEAYEVADTIEQDNLAELCDELGDLLFQIVFYAQLAKEQGRFEFDDVIEAIADKLVRRHPHVFADMRFDSEQEQTRHWEMLKQQERESKTAVSEDGTGQPPVRGSQMDGIARSLPALSLARKIQSRAAQVGFDWPDAKGVFAKLHEEIDELQQAWKEPSKRAEEMGDLLFTCVNLCRHAEFDPEQILRQANQKFERRFRKMESLLGAGQSDKHTPQREVRVSETKLADLTSEQLEVLWEAAKRTESDV
ncbi:MAG: nucleoside triphosphate pyrophosphohydrolase [Thioalkalispiraceae bacterium]|jgi:MazG family protein